MIEDKKIVRKLITKKIVICIRSILNLLGKELIIKIITINLIFCNKEVVVLM